jgi:hypothetical protein
MTTNACQNCGNGVSMMESKLHINGAPEILRIQLYLGDHGEPKDKTPFSIPSQIDLKCFQLPANPVRPALNRRHLKYKLSSVISHFGEEVGTDDQNYYATCRAKRECFMIADHGVVQKTERELRENPQQWPGPNPPANEPCEAICLFYTRIR